MLDPRALRKIIVVFHREYVATIRTKAFLVALVAMPLSFVVAVAVPVATQFRHESRDYRLVVVDQTRAGVGEELTERARDYGRHRLLGTGATAAARSGQILLEPHVGEYDRRAALSLSRRLELGEIAAFIEIPSEALQSDAERVSVRFVSSSPSTGRIVGWVRTELERIVHRVRLERAGIDPASVDRARAPLELVSLSPYRRGSQGQIEASASPTAIQSWTVPAVAALLMFMAVMLGAAPLMQSVLEEKTQRIAEILVSSVSPAHLMLGKLLGASAVSFLLLALYFGGAYALAAFAGHAHWFSWHNVTWLLAFEIVALLMYGSIFLAIGSLCSDLRESQTLMVPAMLLCATPMLLLPLVLSEPAAPLSVGLSLVPFFTPVLMMLRVTLEPEAAAWQAVVGLALSLATAIGCVSLAGRFLRVGLLHRGPAPRLRDVGRWLRQH